MTHTYYSRKTALVTGASTGIGAEFARQLASHGSNLILVARSGDKLEDLKNNLQRKTGARVDTIALDLAQPDSAEELQAEVELLGHDVDILINNAGFATHGDVHDADPQRMADQVQLNVGTLVGTSIRFISPMVKRGSGAVINVASTAGFQSVPHMAVYSATKAFVLSFTRSLWSENRNTGVKVLAINPGATDTPFFETVGENASVGSRRTPEQVVTLALKTLGGRKATVVDGIGNAFVSRVVSRLLPERVILGIAERSVRPS